MKKVSFLILTLSLSLLIIYCDQEKIQKANSTALIAFHTSGMISRESTIKVVFHENMITESEIGHDLEESPFSLSPYLDGKTRWTNSHTLELMPKEQRQYAYQHHPL